MIISVEISYYPLTEDYNIPVRNFIHKLSGLGLIVETGKMSSVISGEYENVMKSLTASMKDLMEQVPSVFSLKISNSCPVFRGEYKVIPRQSLGELFD